MYYFNPYALPHFVALIVNLSLGLYVLSKNSKVKVNRLFALMVFSLALFAFGQFMLHISANPETALFWGNFKMIWALLFGGVFLPHFVIVFTHRDHLFGRKIYLLYLIAFICLLTLPTGLFVADVYKFKYGYDVAFTGKLFSFGMLWAILIGVYLVSSLIWDYLKRGKDQRTLPIFYGLVIYTLTMLSLAGYVILGIFVAIPRPFPYFTTTQIFTAGFFAYGILKYKVLVIKPVTEKEVETPLRYKFAPSTIYLVKGRESREMFSDLANHSIPGLFITSETAERIREELSLEKTPVIHLASSTEEHSINPKDLDTLYNTIVEFMRNAGKSVVLIELDTILQNNFFKEVKRFLSNLNDSLFSNASYMLLSINPKNTDERALKELEGFVSTLYLNSILPSISNPKRIEILSLLNEDRFNFSEISRRLEYDMTPKLNFHLKNLKEAGLIEQDENKTYFLSEKGRNTLKMISDMEKEPISSFWNSPED